MPRKSLELHKLEGTKPGYTPKLTDSQNIPGGRPRCPAHLTDRARGFFRKLVKQLEERRVLTEADETALTLAATTWDRWRTALKHLQQEGEVVMTKRFSRSGVEYEVPSKNLWLPIANDAEKQLLTVLISLGLTTNSRDKAKPVAGVEKTAEGHGLKTGADVLAFMRKRDAANEHGNLG